MSKIIKLDITLLEDLIDKQLEMINKGYLEINPERLYKLQELESKVVKRLN